MAPAADPMAAAVVLAREAAALAEVLDAVAAVSGPATWQGPAADAFCQELDTRRRRLRAVADDLSSCARRQAVLSPPALSTVLSTPVAPGAFRSVASAR